MAKRLKKHTRSKKFVDFFNLNVTSKGHFFLFSLKFSPKTKEKMWIDAPCWDRSSQRNIFYTTLDKPAQQKEKKRRKTTAEKCSKAHTLG